ncbi:MAG: hypothetical protein D6805_09240, partial [Planctomycetota bacterium]
RFTTPQEKAPFRPIQYSAFALSIPSNWRVQPIQNMLLLFPPKKPRFRILALSFSAPSLTLQKQVSLFLQEHQKKKQLRLLSQTWTPKRVKVLSQGKNFYTLQYFYLQEKKTFLLLAFCPSKTDLKLAEKILKSWKLLRK